MSDNPRAVPHQPLTAPGAEINAMANLFASLAAGMWTVIPFLVHRSWGGSAMAGPGTVDGQPMVGQVDGGGNTVPHGVINGLPVMRLQGGTNAVVIDPQAGDIGIAIFAMRDISAVKENRAPSQPGSQRRYNPADGIYIGGILGPPPVNHIQVANSGITLNAPTVLVNGELRVTGEVIARYGGASVTLSQHTHPSNGSPPTPGT